jgi:signal peptidase I
MRRKTFLVFAVTVVICAVVTVAPVALAGKMHGASGAHKGGGTRDYRIPSPSMEPTLPVGSIIEANVGGFPLIRGSIYVFHPNGVGDTALYGNHVATVTYIKRLVGMPGDWLRSANGHVQICGGPAGHGCRPLSEPYVSSTTISFPLIHVAAGHYFMMGDNRQFSDDSRDWGSIRPSQFIGRFLKIVRR